MLPEALNFSDFEGIKYPTSTFKIDLGKNKVVGKTDNVEAVKQAVFLMLKTERNYSEIYEDYGLAVNDLIGQDVFYIMSDIKRRIKETLKEDDRILEVDSFTFNEVAENLEVSFVVHSIYGNFTESEVFKI